jgi:UDP-N-acetylglucosamine--N-acetylmuramyl-(pentapeptide) pyrophosphoryl-undecaprenol N-acetylglucosamine transferase
VAEQLIRQGCRVLIVVSPKEVDQQAISNVKGMAVLTVPAVGLVRGRVLAFVKGLLGSYRVAKEAFRENRPNAALAMGGFTSAAPILAAKRVGARTFLHESNTIPGRANRWLSRLVDQSFVGFPTTARLLRSRRARVTGTPVRAQFRPRNSSESRKVLGLEPEQPVVLVMGGSQGASAINQLIIKSLPMATRTAPRWQWLHLTGPADLAQIRSAYASCNAKAVVHPFLSTMDVALDAATAAVSRAGASSLAELAAMQLPAILIPYPDASDDHQLHNARVVAESCAAYMLEQKTASPERLLGLLQELMENPSVRERTRNSLARWHAPHAAEEIAGAILNAIGFEAPEKAAGVISGQPNGPTAEGFEKRDLKNHTSLTLQFR